MDFAKSLLGKYGWKEGDGLGRNNDGINVALKPNYKFNKSGLGHNQADELNNHWWETVFNNAASNVDVTQTADGAIGMVRKSEKPVDITTKTYSIDAKANAYYNGQFLKTSTLINASQEVRDGKGASSESDSSDDDDTTIRDCVASLVVQNPIAVVDDEKLFKACNGRTAHKGARHGLSMSGKLARIEAQERAMLTKLRATKAQDTYALEVPASTTTTDAEWIEVKRPKKHNKHSPNVSDEKAPTVESTLYVNEYSVKSKKKSKKTRQIAADLASALDALSPAHEIEINVDQTISGTKSDKLSRKRKHSKDTTTPHTSVAELRVGDTAVVVTKKSKGTKKSKRTEEDAATFLKTPESQVVTPELSERQIAKAERKRVRQMRRLAKQVEEVSMHIDE